MSSVRRQRGRLFQIRGPTAPKLLSPKLLCVRGTTHMLSEETEGIVGCLWRRKACSVVLTLGVSNICFNQIYYLVYLFKPNPQYKYNLIENHSSQGICFVIVFFDSVLLVCLFITLLSYVRRYVRINESVSHVEINCCRRLLLMRLKDVSVDTSSSLVLIVSVSSLSWYSVHVALETPLWSRRLLSLCSI